MPTAVGRRRLEACRTPPTRRYGRGIDAHDTPWFVGRARDLQDASSRCQIAKSTSQRRAAPPGGVARACCSWKLAALRWLMGCSASTQHAIAAADGLPRAKRDPPAADKHAGDSPGRRFEAPFSGASAEAPLAGVKVSKRGGPLQFASLSPAMVILDEFLTDEECEGLVALASGGALRWRARQGAPRACRAMC